MQFSEYRNHWPRLILMIALLAGASLACNLPFSDVEPSPTEILATVEIPATEAPVIIPTAVELTPGQPSTVPAIIETPDATKSVAAPSETPTVEIPTLAATVTPSHTPTRRPNPTVTQEGTVDPSATDSQPSTGPLTFHYQIDWRLNPSDPLESFATVTVTAAGGGGGYIYLWDEIEQDGPIWEYSWRSCKGDPHSITVNSADGQSVTVNYFENPPCPTPMPTP